MNKLLVLAMFVLLLCVSPGVVGTDGTTQAQVDTIGQVNQPTVASTCSAASSTAMQLVAGTSYIIVSGARGAGGGFELLRDGQGGTDFAVLQDGTINGPTDLGTSHLLAHYNVSSVSGTTPFWAAVAFTPATTGDFRLIRWNGNLLGEFALNSSDGLLFTVTCNGTTVGQVFEAPQPASNDAAILAQVGDGTRTAGTCSGGSVYANSSFLPGGSYIVKLVRTAESGDAARANINLKRTSAAIYESALGVYGDGGLKNFGFPASVTYEVVENRTVTMSGTPMRVLAVKIGNPPTGDAFNEMSVTIGVNQENYVGADPTFTGYLGLLRNHTFSAGGCAGSRFATTWNASVLMLPEAADLSGVVATVPLRHVLTWTDAPGTVLGYNVTRYDNATGSTGTIPLGVVNSYSEPASTSNVTYTVAAWNGNGTGAASNAVTLRIPVQRLSGSEGALYGGNKAQLASAMEVSELSLDILYGLLIVLLFAAAGFGVGSAWGAAGGAAAGVLAAMAFGMFPVWVIVFLVVMMAGGYLALARRSGGEA